MLVLAVETSCDDTSCAVVGDDCRLHSSIVSSQNLDHARFGGIVPEIASRRHLENIVPVYTQALNAADVSLKDIDGVCATLGPGLIGSLLVGVMFAKGIAFSARKPFYGVNHIEGHFFAPFLQDEKPSFPYLALVASGGHTAIYIVKGFRDYRCIGQTRDDAAGESFDKVAKILGLGYPGGAAIQQCAGNIRGSVPLPRPLAKEEDFSFSGLKTHVLNLVKKQHTLTADFVADIASSFQATVVELLVEKTVNAAEHHNIAQIVISGGVSANRLLRERITERAAEKGMHVFIPPLDLCTDNAAMIGVVGHHFLSAGVSTPLDVSAIPDWSI